MLFRGEEVASTFAILAVEIVSSRGESLPVPPYPRPEFRALEELTVV